MNRRQFIKTSATATVLTSQTPALAGMSSPLPDFRFQSNFWINLHHTLYYQTQVLETVYGLGTAHLAPMEERAYEELKRVRGEYAHDWYEALRIYRVNYASLDFVFSDTMVHIDNALARANGADLPVHRDLPAPLQQALTLAAPAYRSSLWPHHDAGNRAFVAELQTKANRFGPGLARRLAQLYRTPWLREPYVVDVMPYAHVC